MWMVVRMDFNMVHAKWYIPEFKPGEGVLWLGVIAPSIPPAKVSNWPDSSSIEGQWWYMPNQCDECALPMAVAQLLVQPERWKPRLLQMLTYTLQAAAHKLGRWLPLEYFLSSHPYTQHWGGS